MPPKIPATAPAPAADIAAAVAADIAAAPSANAARIAFATAAAPFFRVEATLREPCCAAPNIGLFCLVE